MHNSDDESEFYAWICIDNDTRIFSIFIGSNSSLDLIETSRPLAFVDGISKFGTIRNRFSFK